MCFITHNLKKILITQNYICNLYLNNKNHLTPRHYFLKYFKTQTHYKYVVSCWKLKAFSDGNHSLDRISLDLFSWSKVSVKFGVWSKLFFSLDQMVILGCRLG